MLVQNRVHIRAKSFVVFVLSFIFSPLQKASFIFSLSLFRRPLKAKLPLISISKHFLPLGLKIESISIFLSLFMQNKGMANYLKSNQHQKHKVKAFSFIFLRKGRKPIEKNICWFKASWHITHMAYDEISYNKPGCNEFGFRAQGTWLCQTGL